MHCYFCALCCTIRIFLLFCLSLVIIMVAVVYGRCTQTY